MQCYVNVFLRILPELVILIFFIIIILLIRSRAKLVKERDLNRELIECKDHVLDEFRHIRHTYNNIFQTLLSFIEDENFTGLTEYKSTLLEQTYKLNRNSLVQFVKIKDKRILVSLYKLFIYAKEKDVFIHLTVYNEIPNLSLHEIEIYPLLLECIDYGCQLGIKDEKIIEVRMHMSDLGLRFLIENLVEIKPNQSILEPALRKNKGDNIFKNIFIKDGRLIQEITLPITMKV